jgi:hypothetical protein
MDLPGILNMSVLSHYANDVPFRPCRALRCDPHPALIPPAPQGYTPLHLAALRGHAEAVRVLGAAGADVTAKDVRGCKGQGAERGGVGSKKGVYCLVPAVMR